MTVAALPERATYMETGDEDDLYSIPCQYKDASQIVVARFVDGAEVAAPSYSVSGDGEAYPPTGKVQLTASIAGATLEIRRVTPRTQPTVFTDREDFPADLHQDTFDRLAMAMQEQDADLGRALLVPRGEAVTVLEAAADRAGKFPLWSADGGELLSSFGDTGDDSGFRADMAAGTGGGLIGWLANAAGAILRTFRAKLFEAPFSLEDFGGGTGLADNTAALLLVKAALAAAGGGVLQFGRGNYNFASAALAACGGIELPSKTKVRGWGKGLSKVTITGTTACYFFMNENCASDVLFEDFTARGNSVATNNSIGNFLWVKVFAGLATADVVNVVTKDVRLENFGGDHWTWFVSTHPTWRIRRCGAIRPDIKSEAGNCRDPSNLGVPTRAIEFLGLGGVIEDCFVVGFSGDLDYIKGGIVAYGGVRRLQIIGGSFRNTFQAVAIAEAGGYAITLYDITTSDIVTGTLTVGVDISNPYSVGIYQAGTRNTRHVAPHIYGSVDTTEGSLPKGAIVLNGCNNVRIEAPDLHDNVGNLRIVGPADVAYNADMDIVVAGGSGRGATGIGASIAPGITAASLFGGVRLENYEETGAAGAAFVLHPTTTKALQNIRVNDCVFGSTGSEAVDLNRENVAYHANTNIALDNVEIRQVGSGHYSISGAGGTDDHPNSGLLALRRVRYIAAAAYHLVLGQSTNVILTDHECIGAVSSGNNMELEKTRGHFVDNVAFNGSTLVANTANGLGRAKPTWTSQPAVTVQNALVAAGGFERWRNMGTTVWKGLNQVEA